MSADSNRSLGEIHQGERMPIVLMLLLAFVLFLAGLFRPFTQVTKLWAQIENAHKQGYALDNEEAEQGVACVGVPLHDPHGKMVAGLSISAPRDRRRETWIPIIKKAGADISARLGYLARPA